jgi:hypothetical protein
MKKEDRNILIAVIVILVLVLAVWWWWYRRSEPAETISGLAWDPTTKLLSVSVSGKTKYTTGARVVLTKVTAKSAGGGSKTGIPKALDGLVGECCGMSQLLCKNGTKGPTLLIAYKAPPSGDPAFNGQWCLTDATAVVTAKKSKIPFMKTYCPTTKSPFTPQAMDWGCGRPHPNAVAEAQALAHMGHQHGY